MAKFTVILRSAAVDLSVMEASSMAEVQDAFDAAVQVAETIGKPGTIVAIEYTVEPNQVYKVVQGTAPYPYIVTENGCTCPDYVHRQADRAGKCKHMVSLGYGDYENRPDADENTFIEFYGATARA